MNAYVRYGFVVLFAIFLSVFETGTASAAYVGGRVLDQSGVKAMGGAQITIPELDRTEETDSDGTYRFVGVPPGQYTVRVTYAGAEPIQQEIEVTAGGNNAVNFALVPLGEMATILTVGQQANLASGLSRQRAADTVESVLTRDAIGQFPDQNVAESLRRVTGINVLNDQGEGRFVAIRGLDPNLNSSSINGARVPAPESDVRSVALDVLPSELIESIEIKKSLTPDMDGDTIGGSVEINTTSAFDRAEPFLSVTLEGSYNNLNEEISPKGAIDFSTTLSDKFGVSGGFSYYRRKFATDNIEPSDWSEADDGTVYAEEMVYRDYDVRRTRLAASLGFDLKIGDDTTLFARGLYSRFEDQEFRSELVFGFDEEPSEGTATTARFLSDDGEIEVVRNLKDRFEAQEITSIVFGGETFADKWTFNYQASYSRASEREMGSLDTMDFARSFEEPGELDILFDYSNFDLPWFSVSPDTRDLFLDASEYEFDGLDRTTLSDATDEEWGFQFDVTRSFSLEQGTFEVQVGGKARLRDKEYDAQIDIFDGFDGDFTLADVVGEQSYSLGDISPVVDPSLNREFYNANMGLFERDDIDTTIDSNVEDFHVSEDIFAGYVLGRYENTSLTVIAGVRVEHTRNRMMGNIVELFEEGAIFEGEELEDDTVFISPVEFRRDYTDWLPSLNLRYEASENVVLRLGVFKSVVRPNIEQIAPRFAIEENDEGDREGEFGNPDLQPYRAWNVDVSAEWYFDTNAVVQVGLFYKDVKNFIVPVEFEDVTFNGIFATEAVIPLNGESATIKGVEFNYQQALTFMPAPFDGLLIGFNYTYTDASGMFDGRKIPLIASAKNTFNATIGYDKGPISIRVAGTYRDEYLDELGGDPEEDRYVKDHFQLDISVKYRVTDYLTLFADFINVNDAEFKAFQKGPGGNRLLQYERYSWTGKFGAKATF